MGRLVVVVVFLVAIALLVNKYVLNDGDQPPAGALDKPAAKSDEKPAAPAESDKEAAAPAAPKAPAKEAAAAPPAETAADAKPASADVTSAAADVESEAAETAPTDAQGESTAAGATYNLLGNLAFFVLPVAAVLVTRAIAHATGHGASPWPAVAAWTLVATTALVLAGDGLGFFGLAQRIYLLSAMGWTALAAGWLWRPKN